MKANLKTKIEGTSHALCRTPHFSPKTSLEEAWPELKKLIRESSPEFYPFIAPLSVEELAQQSEKIQFTVWKYFNRSRYRSTPFGKFAAVSLVPWQNDPATNAIVLEQSMQVQEWPAWSNETRTHFDRTILYKAIFRTSPMCYQMGEEYRYLYKETGFFALNVIAQRSDINYLLTFCEKPRTYFDIADHLFEQLKMGEKQIYELVDQLLDLQVLECDQQPNITGTDFYTRLNLISKNTDKYKIAGRKILHGGLSSNLTTQLSSYIHFMKQCLPDLHNPLLEKFKDRFLETWEHQSVPLSLALDPLLGIGYGLQKELAQPSLIGELQYRPRTETPSKITFRTFEQFLMNSMMQAKPVQLAQYRMKKKEKSKSLPNTFSVLFHLYNGTPVIGQAGGASASSLVGRFTGMNHIYAYALEVTDIEKRANPEALFFDVAYQCEGHTDNVNRRQHLYETELAIGSWSTLPTPLKLKDILLSVRENQLVLHHKESGKRLVPRMASAYNYQRSDLDLFRFLCDLQHQGLQSDLSFHLAAIFPGLDIYPRVYYEDLIVSPAQWRLPAFKKIKELKEWISQQEIQAPFLIGQLDQTLTIDPQSDQDLSFLLLYQRQQANEIYLTEALIGENNSVMNEKGLPYHAQFIAHLAHRDNCYKRYPLRNGTSAFRDLRMPGSEWLYFEFYMQQELMDHFLDKEIRQLLNEHRRHICEWFFIRYNQPEPHLRLRIKLKNPDYLAILLKAIPQLMNIGNHYGHLRKLEIKGYEREIARYGSRQMDMVEHFFYLDSVSAMKQLKADLPIRYASILDFARHLCETLLKDSSQQVLFYKKMAESFAEEMAFNHADFKRINQAYQQTGMGKRNPLNKRIQKVFLQLAERYHAARQLELLADLIHLHVNRRFSGAARLHEAVLYQYLYKYTHSQLRIKS